MNLVGEGMMEIVVKAAQYAVRLKEIVLPKGQYLAFAHACRIHHVDARPRAFFDGSMANEVFVHDSFKFAAPSGWVTVRCEAEAPPKAMVAVVSDIVEERQRQVKKFGEQHHPDFWATPSENAVAEAKRRCDYATANGSLTWEHVLEEEVAEALFERDPVKLRAELIQVAAVCAAWVEDIDSRK